MEGDAVLVFDDDVVVEAEKVMATCSNAKLRREVRKCLKNQDKTEWEPVQYICQSICMPVSEKENKKPAAATTPSTEAAKKIQIQDSRRRKCRFFAFGRCKFGDTCTFSHQLNDLPPADSMSKGRRLPCSYFIRGSCRFGDECHLRHNEQDKTATEPSTSNDSDAILCGICYEDVVRQGKRFGLLTCDHSFCIDCIRTWRGTGNSEKRKCPECRKLSHFVVPASRFSVGKEREQYIEQYVIRLSKQRCRSFTGELGSCKFGPHCLYAHVNSLGEDMKSRDRMSQGRHRGHHQCHHHGGGGQGGEMHQFFNLLQSFQMMG